MAFQEFSDILKIDSQESIPYATWASVLTVGCNTDPRLGLTYLRLVFSDQRLVWLKSCNFSTPLRQVELTGN